MKLEGYKCPDCDNSDLLFTFSMESTTELDSDKWENVLCQMCYWVGNLDDLVGEKNAIGKL